MMVLLKEQVAASLVLPSGALAVTSLFMVNRNVNRSVFWLPSSNTRLMFVNEGANGFDEDEMAYE